MLDTIKALRQKSPAEIDLLDRIKNLRSGNPERQKLFHAFRQLEFERNERRKILTEETWDLMKSHGYITYKRQGNAAYESGHSDHIDHTEDYLFWGILAPDGTEFPGDVTIFDGFDEALAHFEGSRHG
jgi:hypothetical protein